MVRRASNSTAWAGCGSILSRLEKGVGDAACARFRRLRVRLAGRLRREHGDQLFDEALPPPENTERLVEQQAMLMLLHEDRVQRRVKVLAVADAGGLDRRQGVQHRARPQRHARVAQGAREMCDVLRQDAAACRLSFQKSRSFGLVRPNSGAAQRLRHAAPPRTQQIMSTPGFVIAPPRSRLRPRGNGACAGYPISSRRRSARVSSISFCAFAPSILAMSS